MIHGLPSHSPTVFYLYRLPTLVQSTQAEPFAPRLSLFFVRDHTERELQEQAKHHGIPLQFAPGTVQIYQTDKAVATE